MLQKLGPEDFHKAWKLYNEVTFDARDESSFIKACHAAFGIWGHWHAEEFITVFAVLEDSYNIVSVSIYTKSAHVEEEIAELARILFHSKCVRGAWVQPKNQTLMDLCLFAGMTVTTWNGENSVLVMTPFSMAERIGPKQYGYVG